MIKNKEINYFKDKIRDKRRKGKNEENLYQEHFNFRFGHFLLNRSGDGAKDDPDKRI